MMKKIVFLCVCILIGLFTLAACGGGGEISKEPEISVVSQVSETDDSSVAAEEPSEVSAEESREEVSDIKLIVEEPDYTIESFLSSSLKLISKGKKGEKDEIRYGILFQNEEDSHIFLAPDFIEIYEPSIYRYGVVAIKDYDGGEVLLFDNDGNRIGEYLSTPGNIGYPTRPWSEFGVFAKKEGGYVIFSDRMALIFDNVEKLVLPDPQKNDYLYFETSDEKCFVAEVYGKHTLRFAEVENLEKYDKENYAALQAVAERFRTAMAEKDEETIKDCMTEKLYRVFKSGTESSFKLIYGVPRGTVTGDMNEFDICAKSPFLTTWINPLPGSPSHLVYPSFMPYIQIWLQKGDDGIWRVCDIREEGDA